MDVRRRRMLVALALAPVAASGRAAASPPAETPLALRVGEASSPAVAAPPLHYGDGPGFTLLRVRRDAPTRIALDNRLGRPTSLDLHGLRVPAALGGGGPLPGTVPPGTTAEIDVRPPDSGTFWFHPGVLDPERDDTAAGLAGVLVVEDAAPFAVDADLVALLTEDADPATVAVDWGPAPRRETLRPGARVRLRLVNGSTRRAVTVACTGAETRVVAIDGQPSALFRPRRDAVPLGPGSRCDLVFDMGAVSGSEVRVLAGPGDAGPVALVLRAEGEPVPPRPPVAPLPPNPALPVSIALERATRATLVAAAVPGQPNRWTINGASGLVLPGAPLFRAKRGAPVVLTLTNAAPDTVGFRLGGFCFRRLHDRDDGWQPYWLESLLVAPGATHFIAFVADQPGRWAIGSPIFAQAAGGLRTWFEVS